MPPVVTEPPPTTEVTIDGVDFILAETNLLSGLPQVGNLFSMSIRGYGGRLADIQHDYSWSAVTLTFDDSGDEVELREFGDVPHYR